MRLVAWCDGDGRQTWGLADDAGRVWDAGAASGRSLAQAQDALLAEGSASAFVRALAPPEGPAAWTGSFDGLERSGALRLPWQAPEVWAAGLTYKASEDARRRESAHAGLYAAAYAAERPELFFKAAGGRVRGPGEAVGLRPDSRWQVPEPEVALIVGRGGNILGYTAGNDMSCRDIEGENPLWLPQAKMYDGSCALGPAVRLGTDGAGAPGWIALAVERAGRTVFEGRAGTDRMVRTFASLVDWLGRAYTVAPGTVLLTGTCVVPPDEFSLQEGDVVRIAVDGVGTLSNVCRTVAG